MNFPASTASDPRRLTAHPENGRVAALPRLHPHCWRGIFLLLALALALSACGGADFRSADDGTELAGAAGDVDPGTGGTAGSAGAPQGGSAGSSGPAGAGTGGLTAGAAGSGSAGSGSSGASGAGGEPSGGAAGSGPTEPTCTPEEAITTATIPESFIWDGFDGEVQAPDGEFYCGYTSGGPCVLRSSSLTITGNSLGISTTLSCAATFEAGPCGAETTCDSTIDPTALVSVHMTIVASGNGYRLVATTRGTPPTVRDAQSCYSEIEPGEFVEPLNDASADVFSELLGALSAAAFACP